MAITLFAALVFAGGRAFAGYLSAEDERLYRQAFAAADEGKLDYARALAAKTSDKLPRKALTWVEYSRPASGATFEQIAEFVRANPTWPQISTLARRAEEAITAATPGPVLLDWFAEFPPQTAEGMTAYGAALIAAGDSDQGTELIRRAWVQGSFGPLQEREFLSRWGDLLRPEDQAARLDRLLWDHQDEAATAQLRRVDPDLQRLARARMALARDAARIEALVAAVPEKLRDDPGLNYELARYRREHEHEDLAIDLLKGPAADQARPEAWWTERAALVRHELQIGDPAAAFGVADAHGAIEGVALAESEWLSGWICLRYLHDPDTALDRFKRLYEHVQSPASRARAAFWAGRAAEALQDGPQATHWYGVASQLVTSFYGQLAAARLDPAEAWSLPADPVPTEEDRKDFDRMELVRIARALGQIGQDDLVRPFVLRVTEVAATPGERALAAGLAAEAGRPDLAVAVAHRAEREGVVLVNAGYPVPSLPGSIKPEHALVLGLILQESAFHRDAVSSAGARGLMQLMPATAAKLARAINLVFKRQKTLDTALTHDTGLNLRLGSGYLQDLLAEFDGSYILAVAAYNAGPARVHKWMHDFGDPRDPSVDPVDWIESIPFAETRAYVEHVLEGVQVYRRRLGGTGVVVTLASDLRR